MRLDARNIQTQCSGSGSVTVSAYAVVRDERAGHGAAGRRQPDESFAYQRRQPPAWLSPGAWLSSGFLDGRRGGDRTGRPGLPSEQGRRASWRRDNCAAGCGARGGWQLCPYPGRVRKAITLVLNTTFTGQCSGGVIRAIGRRRAGGTRIFNSSGEVRDADDRLLAIGEATFRLRSGSEQAQGVPMDFLAPNNKKEDGNV